VGFVQITDPEGFSEFSTNSRICKAVRLLMPEGNERLQNIKYQIISFAVRWNLQLTGISKLFIAVIMWW